MATDGDKIAAATLTVKLLELLPGPAMVPDIMPNAIELYGDVLRQIAQINPHTGKPYTQEEIHRLRNQGKI